MFCIYFLCACLGDLGVADSGEAREAERRSSGRAAREQLPGQRGEQVHHERAPEVRPPGRIPQRRSATQNQVLGVSNMFSVFLRIFSVSKDI